MEMSFNKILIMLVLSSIGAYAYGNDEAQLAEEFYTRLQDMYSAPEISAKVFIRLYDKSTSKTPSRVLNAHIIKLNTNFLQAFEQMVSVVTNDYSIVIDKNRKEIHYKVRSNKTIVKKGYQDTFSSVLAIDPVTDSKLNIQRIDNEEGYVYRIVNGHTDYEIAEYIFDKHHNRIAKIKYYQKNNKDDEDSYVAIDYDWNTTADIEPQIFSMEFYLQKTNDGLTPTQAYQGYKVISHNAIE